MVARATEIRTRWRARAAIRLLAPGVLALSPSSAATAQSLEEARSAYVEGRLLEAADMGEALATSAGYAVAAQSLAVHLHFEASEEERDEVARRAIAMGEAAIDADSTNAQAYFQAAHALGRYAQGVGTVTILREGLAGRIRQMLDEAIRLDPYLAEARIALGGWHADIDEAGFVARQLYGGNKEAAVVLFEQALQLEPESRVALYEYAVRLPSLDEDDGRERARAMLDKAVGLPVADAYDGFIRELAVEALEALANG